MSIHACTQVQLVEHPDIGLFAERRRTTVPARGEAPGATGTLQRETPGEVVLPGCIRQRDAYRTDMRRAGNSIMVASAANGRAFASM